jgi:hypothetical protein
MEAAPINMEFNGCSIVMKNKEQNGYDNYYKINDNSPDINRCSR